MIQSYSSGRLCQSMLRVSRWHSTEGRRLIGKLKTSAITTPGEPCYKHIFALQGSVSSKKQLIDQFILSNVRELKPFTLSQMLMTSSRCKVVLSDEVLLLMHNKFVKEDYAMKSISKQELALRMYAFSAYNAKNKMVGEMLQHIVPFLQSPNFKLHTLALENAFFGLQNMTSEHMYVRDTLDALVFKIRYFSEPLKCKSFGKIFKGLQSMDSESQSVQNVLFELALKLRRSNNTPMDAKTFAMSLSGLRNMNSSNPAVQQVIDALAEKIEHSTDTFKMQTVAMSLHGLKEMDSSSKAVQRILWVLSKKVSACMEPMNGQAMAMSLTGLRGMNSECAAVQAVLTALHAKMKVTHFPVTASVVAMSLYGLRSMTSKESIVRDVLASITVKIERCNNHFSAQEVAMALNGFRQLSSSFPVVQHALAAVVAKTTVCREQLGPQAIAMALHGLQCTHSGSNSLPWVRVVDPDQHSKVVAKLLLWIAKQVHSCNEPLEGQALAMCFHGIRGMSPNTDGIEELLDALTIQLSAGTRAGKVSMTLEQVSIALNGLKNMVLSNDSVYQALQTLAVQLELVVERATENQNGVSSDGCWKASSISHILFGLRMMSSEEAVVRRVLLLTNLAIRHIPPGNYLTSAEFAAALNGLRNMSNKEQEVQAVLGFLARDIELVGPLRPQEIAMAFNGFQSMSLNNEYANLIGGEIAGANISIQKILSELANRTDYCTESFGAIELSMCFEGIRGIYQQLKGQECREVEAVLRALAVKVGVCYGNYTQSETRLPTKVVDDKKIVSLQSLLKSSNVKITPKLLSSAAFIFA
jgi:hypothetical protein